MTCPLGFRSFILCGNVVDLAVGIVIGAAFTATVNGFVSAFLTPLVGLATGATGDMSRKTFTVGAIEFPYGAFVNATISFLLLASAALLTAGDGSCSPLFVCPGRA
ncbi:MscL family protein [Streptomyces scabiei]|uniref:large conductance mechanosensitive channel protein MscL n=1 Tax=Streptomyces scabiei TaxID=1930 RepID=UPI0029AC5632|nr:MscL family protein [Streptomyces scabiei]MDX3114525.1 MscL family protein [Streptomyces scabiei]